MEGSFTHTWSIMVDLSDLFVLPIHSPSFYPGLGKKKVASESFLT